MKDTPQPGRPSQVADLPVPRVPDGFVPKERAEFLRTIGDKLTNAVFFQVIHHASGAFQFSHVSSGCQDVLGLSTDPLYERATALTDLILDEDRPAFFAARPRLSPHTASWISSSAFGAPTARCGGAISARDRGRPTTAR